MHSGWRKATGLYQSNWCIENPSLGAAGVEEVKCCTPTAIKFILKKKTGNG